MNTALAAELRRTHELAWGLVATLTEAEIRRQYHPDISPLGWHLGHMAFAQVYWTREVLDGEPLPEDWKALYFPERNPKALRARRLPSPAVLHAFAQAAHDEALARLATPARAVRGDLLQDDYLLHFLIQHNSQHLETMQQGRQARALAAYAPTATPDAACAAQAPSLPAVTIAAQVCDIGHVGGPVPYDNELPRHPARLNAYTLAARPVSNAAYLGFMAAGGYARREFWSDDGWRLCMEQDWHAPYHWRYDAAGHWVAVAPEGPVALDANAPVYGLSHHEATAFARYAGCRLPTEAEWEHAVTSGAIAPAATWEWCADTFAPYPGFRAFPYDGYSTPWFDGRHYVLRGASRYTAAGIRRPTFRNFYTADKRHVFAGLRLARSLGLH